MKARTLGLAAALAASVLTPAAALAQVRDFTTAARRGESVPKTDERSRDDETKSVMARSQAVAPAGPKIEREFVVVAPLAYNSNPTQVTTGEDGGEHVTPTAVFTYKRTGVSENELTIEAVAQVDDYFGRKDADQSVGALTITYQFGNAAKGLAPYVSYDRVEICGGKFESCKLSLDVATLGLAQDFVLAGKAELLVRVWGGRRFSNVAEVELNRAGFNVVAKGPLGTSGVIWRSEHNLEFQSYTSGASDGRHDVNYKGDIALLKPLGKSGAILGAKLGLEHNDSDILGRDFKAWDFGPRFILQRAF